MIGSSLLDDLLFETFVVVVDLAVVVDEILDRILVDGPSFFLLALVDG